MFTFVSRSVFASALALVAACQAEGLDLDGHASAVDKKAGLFADNLPDDFRAELYPKEKGRVHLDATGKRKFFPMPRDLRSFDSVESLGKFAKAELNAELVQDQDGWTLRGETTAYGESVWLEVETQMLYAVTDPAMALLGGVTGKVLVGEESYCVDGRKSCDEGLADYLVPIADPTALTDIDRCNDDDSVCAHFHAFYNKVDLCWFKYARHGANTRLTHNLKEDAKLIVRDIRVCGPEEPGAIDIGKLAGAGWSTFICMDFVFKPELREPRTIGVSNVVIGTPGHGSHAVTVPDPTDEVEVVEASAWAVSGGGPFSCAPEPVEIDATFVCARHTTESVRPGRTGNGPNHSVCFE